MRNREKQTAERFGILDRLTAFEQAILTIPGIIGSDVDMDLNGFYDGIRQVVIVPGYHIDAPGAEWYQQRREMISRIVETANAHGLHRTGDPLEDYGEHLYIVFQCDGTWPQAQRPENI